MVLNCNSIKSAHLTTILRNLPALEALSLCVSIEDIPKNLEKVELKIKTLKILSRLNELFKHINTNELTELNLDLAMSDFEGYKDVIKFIGYQKKLELLSLQQYAASLFLDYSEVYKFDFRLKNFVIDGNYVADVYEERLSRFLMIHKDSLETVRLFKMINFWRFNIYELIWNNMPNIKHIDMNIHRLAIAMETRNDDRWNNHIAVETITFYGNANSQDIQCLRTVLKKFPATKSLGLNHYRIYSDWNKIIRQVCSDMKTLTVLYMPCNFNQKLLKIQSIYFPNLEEFYMGAIKDERISHFFRRHSKTLKKIFVVWSNDDLISPTIREIVKYENNPKLFIQTCTKDLTVIYNNQIIKCNKRWTLELIVGTWNFCYKFPDDSFNWRDHGKSCVAIIDFLLPFLTANPTTVFTSCNGNFRRLY